MHASPSTPTLAFRRVRRLVFWNTLLTLAGLILVMAAGEAYLRLNVPFLESSWDMEFVPGVGFLYQPHTLVRATDGVEFWIESRVNSLGFLDREPLAPEEAAESCHIAIIGDSFVEAREVQLANRFPVLIEKFAKENLPELNVTTSAFGRRGTGQIQQIPFYDHYASKMKPDLLVLTFFRNDFLENSSFIHNLLSEHPWHPDHPPHYFAKKSENGEISLHPIDPEFENHKIIPSPSFSPHLFSRLFSPSSLNRFARYKLYMKMKSISLALSRSRNSNRQLLEKARVLRMQPQYALLMDDRDGRLINRAGLYDEITKKEPLIVVQDALDFTAFSLDQFQERAERDGASLVILAIETIYPFRYVARRKAGHRTSIDVLREMADAREIPVIDLYDYMVRLGGRIEDRLSEMRLVHDKHWNDTGHRRVAEAVLEYLKQNRELCGARAEGETVP